MRPGLAGALAVLVSLSLAHPAAAQTRSELQAARQAGAIGERFDGYLGVATASSQSVRRQVAATNIRRRSLYIDLAARRRVTAQAVGIAAGCELLARTAIGQAYMLSDGQWRRRGAGDPPPAPDHCPD